MTAPDAATIAGKLTHVQREAILNAAPGGFGYSSTSLFHAGKASTGSALHERGIVDYIGRLTPLGTTLRLHLQENPHGIA